MSYITPDGNYSEAVDVAEGSIEVPVRPTIDHRWVNSAWVYVQPVPQVVTMRQARLALLGAGMLASVNTTVAGMTGASGEAARIEWEFSSEVQRHKPLVQALAPVLNLTEAQLDQLFIVAATL